jgi:hypothetical protein
LAHEIGVNQGWAPPITAALQRSPQMGREGEKSVAVRMGIAFPAGFAAMVIAWRSEFFRTAR